MRRFLPLVILAALALSSCGGGGGGSSTPTPSPSPTATPTPAPTRVRVRIQWAARSRAETLLSPPASALSVRLVLGNAGSVVLTANRTGGTASYQETLESSTTLPPGEQAFSAAFYASPNLAGAVVAQAVGTLTLAPDGTLSGAITLNQTVRQVSVWAGQHVQVESQKALSFTATDSTGATVALTEGSAFFQLADASSASLAQVAAGQELLGLAAGVAQVRVSVDGVTSDPQAVTIDPLIKVSISPETAVRTLGESQVFNAFVTGSSNTALTWSLVEGSSGGTLTQTGFYTAPQTPGTYHVTATSVADPTKKATATVTVTSGSGTVIIQ